MAGGIFQPMESVDTTIDNDSRNPLLCYLCNELYEEPCLLQCYHTFCSKCLRGRASDGKLSCPLCGKNSTLKDSANLPPTDPLLHFLVESSVDEWPPCSNCDMFFHTQDSGPMFFCNTCSQSLCGPCRDETHRARMFSKHDIVHVSKRTKDIHRKCGLHGEPYIMFSTLKKTMLCINCFRDMSIDGRAHCIDLDSAYNQGCKKLDSAVMSIRDLQNSVRDGIILFRALLEELRRNMETEKEAIIALWNSLQEALSRTKDYLLEDVGRQYDAKEHLFRSQLASLGTLLPTIQVHLIMCTTFYSSANKFEFLDLGYMLMDRLASIAHLSYPLRTSQNSQIKTHFKAEFSRNLEPLITEKAVREAGLEMVEAKSMATTISSNNSTKEISNSSPSSFNTANKPTVSTSAPPYKFAAVSVSNRRHLQNTLKMKVMDGGGPFAEHCKTFDTDFRAFTTRFSIMKDQVQELHRDITLRRCLTKKGKVSDILNESAKLERDVSQHQENLENLKIVFDKMWDEQLNRIQAEQEMYQAQISELTTLTSENKRLTTIVRQLEPFIKSITAVVERISPRLRTSLHKEEREDCIQAILEQISTMQPDSQQRVDAIHNQEELRHHKSCGPSPFEECLIHTKGLLRAPMKDGVPIRKESDGTPFREEVAQGLKGRVLSHPPTIKEESDVISDDSEVVKHVTNKSAELAKNLSLQRMELNCGSETCSDAQTAISNDPIPHKDVQSGIKELCAENHVLHSADISECPSPVDTSNKNTEL